MTEGADFGCNPERPWLGLEVPSDLEFASLVRTAARVFAIGTAGERAWAGLEDPLMAAFDLAVLESDRRSTPVRVNIEAVGAGLRAAINGSAVGTTTG